MKYQFPIIVWVAIRKVYERILRPLCFIKSYLLCKAYGVRYKSRHPYFRGKTILRTRKRGDILLGGNVVFDADPVNNLVGLDHPTILDTRAGGYIQIGDNSGFSSVVISSRTRIEIGTHVKCGGNVRIFDHDFHSLSAKDRRDYSSDVANVRSEPIYIGDDVFIGANSIILKGSKIGNRSIIAAGSVVFKMDVPDGSLLKGNPASVINYKKEDYE